MGYAFRGIDHIQLAAPPECEGKAREFFHDILGMTEIEKPEALKKNGGVWFQCGSQEIHIGVENDFRPAKKAHPAIYVENLMELRSHLIERGIEIKDDDKLPGAKRFYAYDPFGNRLEFMERIQ
ncbi:MAG: VOC family protein [Bacillaceae bacterium]|nr:VOC family protein [Bacillaceae bacterium]